MNNEPPGKWIHTPLGKRMQNTRSVMPFVALSVMVYLRGDIGYRLVNPSWFFGLMICEIVLGFFGSQYGTKPNPMFWFAVIGFGLGIYQRIKRWREYGRGITQHSFYLGTSRLDFSWLPAFLRRNRRVERFVDPIFCFVVGMCLLPFFGVFGLWLCAAGACLLVWESDIREMSIHRDLDIVDGMLHSKIQQEVAEQFEPPPSTLDEPPPSGVPTGLGNDIQETIRRRKAKQPQPKKET